MSVVSAIRDLLFQSGSSPLITHHLCREDEVRIKPPDCILEINDELQDWGSRMGSEVLQINLPNSQEGTSSWPVRFEHSDSQTDPPHLQATTGQFFYCLHREGTAEIVLSPQTAHTWSAICTLMSSRMVILISLMFSAFGHMV